MRLTTRGIVALFALEGVAIAALTLGLVDRRLHQQDPAYGINQWGFRGEARARRSPGDIRIAVIGGSAAFEPGVPTENTYATNIFFELQNTGPSNQGYSVVNLAAPNVGADTYPGTVRRYSYLDPDIICVFDGYDVLSGLPPHARERSAMFQLTGYLPILPRRLLGRPAWLSDKDGGIAELLRDDGPAADVTCAGASRAYCASMVDTVRVAIEEQKRAAVVVSPPAVSNRHLQQQRSLATVLDDAFGRHPRFRYLDLTTEIDLKKRINSLDGVHRTMSGDHEVAQRTSQAVLKWIAAGWLRP